MWARTAEKWACALKSWFLGVSVGRPPYLCARGMHRSLSTWRTPNLPSQSILFSLQMKAELTLLWIPDNSPQEWIWIWARSCLWQCCLTCFFQPWREKDWCFARDGWLWEGSQKFQFWWDGKVISKRRHLLLTVFSSSLQERAMRSQMGDKVGQF